VSMKHILFVAVLVWLLVSFVPALSLTALLGKGRKA
jgi:hypothetical protein